MALAEVDTSKVGSYLSSNRGHCPAFPQPIDLSRTAAVIGIPVTSRTLDWPFVFEYKEPVTKADQVPLPAEVCFDLCKNTLGVLLL